MIQRGEDLNPSEGNQSWFCFQLVGRFCSDSAREWLYGVYSTFVAPLDTNLFLRAYSGARRRLGDSVVEVETEIVSILEDCELPVLKGSTLAEVGRVALLRRAMECLPDDAHASFVFEVYQRGDMWERHSLLRALPVLPDPGRFLATGVEACRTNISTVFEAIADENPYPLRYFSDPQFHQLVLKALFIGFPLAKVVGLQERITPDLVRMAEDFSRERRTAGRPVPEDLALITTHPTRHV